MPKIAPAPVPGGVENLTSGDREAVIKVVGRAFAGTTTSDPEWLFHWALGPSAEDRSDTAGRAETITFMLAPEIVFLSNVHQIGMRDADGALQAFALFWRSPGGDKGPSPSMCGMMSFYMKTKQPRLFQSIQGNRLLSVGKTMKTGHRKHAPGPHYYVSIVAVDPDRQGGKLCTPLMTTIANMADAEGIPCYLECSGARCRDIYAHYGYEEKECMTLGKGFKPDEKSGYAPYSEFYAMLRPARPSAP